MNYYIAVNQANLVIPAIGESNNVTAPVPLAGIAGVEKEAIRQVLIEFKLASERTPRSDRIRIVGLITGTGIGATAPAVASPERVTVSE